MSADLCFLLGRDPIMEISLDLIFWDYLSKNESIYQFSFHSSRLHFRIYKWSWHDFCNYDYSFFYAFSLWRSNPVFKEFKNHNFRVSQLKSKSASPSCSQTFLSPKILWSSRRRSWELTPLPLLPNKEYFVNFKLDNCNLIYSK